MGVMNRRRFLAMAAGAGGAAFAATGLWAWLARGAQVNAAALPAEVADGLRSAGLAVAIRKSWALGSDVTITALHPSQQAGQLAIDAALGELERIERAMSIWRPDSQLCRLNHDRSLADPDPLLTSALRSAADLSVRSGGAFDATVQPLWEAYADAQRAGRLPDAGAVESARAKVDWRQVAVEDGRIRLARPGTAVTLNGIAQGLAADRVLAVLRDHGVEHALVNTGEIASAGRKADGSAWTAGIQHPRRKDAYVALARLDGRCMSTSGDYETFFTADFELNHIFDPATGRSPTTLASVTVISPTCIDADGLSTAIFVLGPARGLELARTIPHTDMLLVFKDGRVSSTKGFPLQ